MNYKYRPFCSYSLWRSFKPDSSQLSFHCEMKRGFAKHRNYEPHVDKLLKQDNLYQSIGKLAQQAIWTFHQNPDLFNNQDYLNIISQSLKLDGSPQDIKNRVYNIIKNYRENPFLLNKQGLVLNKGDEKRNDCLIMNLGSYEFNLYYEFDCYFFESENLIHIIDFKTGQSEPDQRQADVYLLIAQKLFPDHSAVASFYNLENQKWSEPIQACPDHLKCVLIELANLAKKHQKEKQQYKQDKRKFAELFPPNPGKRCASCNFKSICDYADLEK